MTSSFALNWKGAAGTGGLAPVESASACISFCSSESFSSASSASRKGAEASGNNLKTVKVGLPRALSVLSFCEASSAARAQGRGTAGLPGSLSSGGIVGGGSKRRFSTFDHARRCHPAVERELVSEDEKAEVSGGEFRSSGLHRLSHFLRELARQDCWASLFEPFHQGSGDFSSHQDSRTHWRPTVVPIPVDYKASRMRASDTERSYVSTGFRTPSPTENELTSSAEVSDDAGVATEPGPCLPDSHALSETAEVSSISEDSIESGPASQNGKGKYNLSDSHVTGNGISASVYDKPQAELCHKLAICVTAEEIGSCENLARWLEERIGSSVLSLWGRGLTTKRVSNLWCELLEGEISLEDSRPPKRTAHVASVKIRNDEGDILVEAYQQMADGRVRPRNRPLSEKMRPGEHVEEACLRGILEELGSQMGARERVVIIPESYQREEEERESNSYPGLPTRYVIHTMDARIDQLPCTEFSTEEDETGHGTSLAGDVYHMSENGSGDISAPLGVKRHFWKWVPERELAKTR